MVSSSTVEPPHRDQDQPEIADPVQQPEKERLIDDLAGDNRLAAVALDRQVPEPGSPAPVEDPVDADLVACWPRHGAHRLTLTGDGLVEPGPFGSI